MNTQEIANKFVELCRTGQWDKAQEELYAENAVSIEMEGAVGFPPRCEGMEAIKAKGEVWKSMVEEFHGVEVSDPIVAENHFTCSFKMDVTLKGQPRKNDAELAIMKVENGKIVSEQFFYPV